MFIEDKPIEHEKEDILNRNEFSIKISGAIEDYLKNNKGSFVIGLNGKEDQGKHQSLI